MATQFSGRAAEVANNLPTPVAVTAATNATPIVITTAVAHGLHVNDVFTVTGVNGNTTANGTFMAGSVTPTTVALLFYPASTAVSGSGAYLSGGALQPNTFGATFPRPADITDGMRAGAYNVAIEALGDRTAYLKLAKLDAEGGKVTGNLEVGGNLLVDGTTTTTGLATLNGGATIPTGVTLTAASGSTTKILGRKEVLRPRVVLTDADHTIDVTQGDRFVVPSTPAAPRTITLKSTTPAVPFDNETMTVMVVDLLNGSGASYSFIREDATLVATFVTTSAGPTSLPLWAEFEFVAGVWRLGLSSGSAYDGVTDYGVIPQTGA